MDPSSLLSFVGMDLQPRIEAVIGLLRNKGQDGKVLVRQTVGLIPFIKNVRNLELVMTAVASNQDIFASIETTSFFIDGITAAANLKKEISNPTIGTLEYFQVVARYASALPLLPGTAILSGMALAKPPNEHYIKRAIIRNAQYASKLAQTQSDTASTGHMNSLLVVCLAKAQWVFDQHEIQTIPLDFYWPYLLDLVYPPNFDGRLQGPVFLDFGSYSQLLAKCLVCLRVLEPFLQRCYQFVCAAVSQYAPSESTASFKTLLFGVALQLQGMCNQILHNRRLEAGVLCKKTLQILQVLGFVIDETGGKFEAYEFTYNICIDVLLESNRSYANEAAVELANWRLKQPLQPVDKGELLFYIELCERILPKLELEVLEEYVLPCVAIYLRPVPGANDRSLLEASHSFMLEYLSLGNSANARSGSGESIDRHVVMYFEEIMALYPSILTWGQFKLAMERVTGSLSQPFERPTTVHGYILDRLFDLGKSTIPGVPIPDSEVPQTGERPPSLRAVYVSTLLRALPDLCSQETFMMWLQRVESMVPEGYNDLTVRERRYIKSVMADVTTGLNLHLADIGIKFWFQQGANL